MIEKKITFSPAWDKRHDDPDKDYGIHGVEIRFELINKEERKATQFVLFTNWMLPHVAAINCSVPDCLSKPTPADLGYHSPYPMYEGQTPVDCCVIGGQCYYDGSSLAAERVYERLLREGDDGVWKELEEEYIRRFGR